MHLIWQSWNLESLPYRGGKKSWAPAILPCVKNANDLLMSVNIIVSLVLNDLFEMFNPIEEDRLDVFECRVFPDLCHDLQPSETICPLSCTRTFWRARGFRYLDIANQVGGEGIQALHRSFLQSFYNHWNCPCEWKMIAINIHGKIASSCGENYVKYYRWNSSGCILIR
jgi:hypothetical protein